MYPEYPQMIHSAFIVSMLWFETFPCIQLFLHCFAIGSDFRQFERTKTNGFLLLILMGVWQREICWGLVLSNWLWNLFLSSSSTNQWTRPLPKTLFKPWALHHHYVLRWAFSRKNENEILKRTFSCFYSCSGFGNQTRICAYCCYLRTRMWL